MRSLITLQAALTGFAWLVVGYAAIVAVLSPRIRDTAFERLALALVTLAAASAAWRAITLGAVSATECTMAVALAFYVITLFWKHWGQAARRRRGDHQAPPPAKKA